MPEFEPNLKAGGGWGCRLEVPEFLRKDAGRGDVKRHTERGEGERVAEENAGVGGDDSVSWIVEVASQVVFSNSAAVHYEILLGRDEKSLSLGFASSITGGGGGGTASVPGQISDHQQSIGAKEGRHAAQQKGVFSRAIRVKVDDTASLWNTPRMPEWDNAGQERVEGKGKDAPVEDATGGKSEGNEEKVDEHRGKRQKKIHLVVLTHGLHSNLGADMLYLKESIDVAAKQAKIDRAKRRQKEKEKGGDTQKVGNDEGFPEDDEDEEEVVVRGFSGNAVRTEKGIKYLGKRLAKYVLSMTYPDQPYKPVTKRSTTEALSHALKPEQPPPPDEGPPSHHSSTIHKEPYHDKKLAYKITSISFIAHSLGGLVQTYAVAYIQKHSPEFFDIIEPINFISMASPFLGLSNENPLYVKFALDFGLVGRTGQDLGLTWRPPTIARSGWGAIVSGISETAHKKIDGEIPPESKPLLRILPTGPAHVVLKKFRNRTVYSNVVNDGIVPLRTSCLLFLDWQGLGRVEKARRENGLVGTMAGWGWAELTGANSTSPSRRNFSDSSISDVEDTNTPTRHGHGADVPQPPPRAVDDDDNRSLKSAGDNRPTSVLSSNGDGSVPADNNNEGPIASLLKFFTPNTQSAKSILKSSSHMPKHPKIYKRSQTVRVGSNSSTPSIITEPSSPKKTAGKATTGDAEHEDPERLSAPPKTSFFESAGDLLKPPLPTVEFLIDPESRPRTIFHDRVYHPEDIPPPPLKKRPTSILRRRSSVTTSSQSSDPASTQALQHQPDSNLSSRDYDDTKHTNPDKDPRDVVDGSAMKVEEKIARAYHKDLSWRKVLVRLEPDAHNNMIVRRMFANAYGWPVIKHLCDTHFSDSAAANTRDEDESNAERAKGEHERPSKRGTETNDSRDHGGDGTDDPKMLNKDDRTDSEVREATDEVPALKRPQPNSLSKALHGSLQIPSQEYGGRPQSARKDSYTDWSDRDWADSEMDSEDEGSVDVEAGRVGAQHKRVGSDASVGETKKGWGLNWTEAIVGKGAGPSSPKGTDGKEIESFLGKKSGNEER